MKTHILDVLAERPVLADGAMGSQLLARGVDPAACLDFVNILDPDAVGAIHRAYLDAGAEVVETNTFGANSKKLERFHLAERTVEINRQGAAIARALAGESAWVAGSMGPLGRIQGEILAATEIQAIYAQQAVALAEGGVDLLILETFSDLDLLLLALSAAKAATGLPVAAQMVFGGAGRAFDGREPGECLGVLRRAGADIVGLNCGLGPKGARDVLRDMGREAGDMGGPVSVFPNAGFPERMGDRLVYPSSPEYFADMLAQCVGLGARLLGGCCGTGPEHIQALGRALGRTPGARRASRIGTRTDKRLDVWADTQAIGRGEGQGAARPPEATVAPPQAQAKGDAWPAHMPNKDPNRELQGFAAGLGRRPMILVELDPPKHLDCAAVLEGAAALALAGVDAITVAENPLASPRMSNIALAGMIAKRTGAETIVHLTGRDRNLIGMQSTIMGLAGLGLTNVLAVTGDPPSAGGEERLTGVYDVRSYELIALLQGFKQGRNALGQDMRSKAAFRIGAAFNPNTRDMAMQVKRMARKAELGAEYFLTQPVYSREKIDALLEATVAVSTPIFLGIMPLASLRNAEFLHNEFPGISIPSPVRERMARAGDQGGREGLEIAWELMEYALPHFAGIYLVPPFNRHAVALELMGRAKGPGVRADARSPV